jgi:hypothetical protein
MSWWWGGAWPGAAQLVWGAPPLACALAAGLAVAATGLMVARARGLRGKIVDGVVFGSAAAALALALCDPRLVAEAGREERGRVVVLVDGSASMAVEEGGAPRAAAVQAQLDEGLARAHLSGEQTLGSYVVHRDDTVSYVVFDLDIKAANLERAWGDPAATAGLRQRVHAAALQLRAALRAEGWAPLLVDSGFKGRHLWCFLQRRLPAAQARAAAHRALAAAGLSDPTLSVEVFPKQDRVPQGGLGNLVKLPLGVHLRTQRRCAVLDEAGQPVADPWALLRSWPRTALPSGPLPSAPPPTPDRPTLTVGAAPAPTFTAGDLDAHPRLAAVLSGCAVLRRVVNRVLNLCWQQVVPHSLRTFFVLPCCV